MTKILNYKSWSNLVKFAMLVLVLVSFTACTKTEKKAEATDAVKETEKVVETQKAEGQETQAAQAAQTAQVTQNTETPKNANSIMLTDLNGQEIDLKNFGGKMMILDFWATHCPPCVQEMPIFNEFHKKYEKDGLVIVAISVDRGRSQAKVQPFIDKHGLEFHVGYPTPEIMAEWGKDIKYIPTTYVIDANGKILERIVGGKPESFWQGYIDKLVLNSPA